MKEKIAKQIQDSIITVLIFRIRKCKFFNSIFQMWPSGDGIDNINFLFSANPDQKLAPSSNVISGGEMSRFLLAIKSSISKTKYFFLR